MVPEDLVRAHRGRALSPGAPVHPRHRAEPGRVLPGARDGQPVLRPRAGRRRRTRWTRLAARTGRRYRLFEYAGHPDAERVMVLMGSGAETARETVACLNARRRAGRRGAGAAVPAVPGRALLAALPATRAPGRRARPDQGAGRDRRAALPRRGRRARPRRTRRRASSHAAGDRRPLRAVVQGVHAGHGRRRSSTSWRSERPRRRFTIGITDDVSRHQPALRPDARHRAARHGARRLLRPRLGRHGRRQQEHDQDHRRRRPACTPRATSSTTRRSPARRPCRTCASGRSRSARPT